MVRSKRRKVPTPRTNYGSPSSPLGLRLHLDKIRQHGRAYGAQDRHSLAYSNAGSILSPSFDPPGSTIFLSANLRLS